MHMDRFARAHQLNGYHVDIEYNRKQNGLIKAILDGGERVIRINCDLILHSRGSSVAKDNLIAVEMKKVTRSALEKQSDRNRLCALTKRSFDDIWSNDGVTHPEHVCGYRLGAFIQLDRKERRCLVEYFQDGRAIEERTYGF